MSEWRSFIDIFHAPKSDIAVLLTTFVLTVVINLTVAIEAGMVMAAFLFMRRMSQVSNVSVMMTGTEDPSSDTGDEIGSLLPKDVMVFEIHGALFFGAAERFADTLTSVNSFPKVLIQRMGDAFAIDATGLRALRDVLKRAQSHDALLLISEIHSQPFMVADKAGLLDLIGRQNLHATLAESLDHANEWLSNSPL